MNPIGEGFNKPARVYTERSRPNEQDKTINLSSINETLGAILSIDKDPLRDYLVEDTVTLSAEALSERPKVDIIRKELTARESMVLAISLENAFLNPPAYESRHDILITEFPIQQSAKLIHIDQYAYADSNDPEAFLMSGPFSNCVAITLYNTADKRGAMCHLARENINHLQKCLVNTILNQNKPKNADCLQDLVCSISNGQSANLQINIIGCNEGAMSFWHKYLDFLGCKNITPRLYNGWTEPKASGYGDNLLNNIKNNSKISRGFIKFSIKDGSINVTKNPDQFKGKVNYTGCLGDDAMIPLLNQDILTNFYNNSKLKFNDDIQIAKNMKIFADKFGI